MLGRQHDLVDRWRQQLRARGLLSSRERPSQDVGGVQCGSPLNLLKRRPDRKRLFALKFPGDRDGDRPFEQPLGRGRDCRHDTDSHAGTELLPRRTREVPRGCACLTGSIGHTAADHVRGGRFGEEQAAESAASPGLGDPDRQLPLAQCVEQDLSQRAIVIGVNVVPEPPPHLRDGFSRSRSACAGSSAEAVTRTWTPSSLA